MLGAGGKLFGLLARGRSGRLRKSELFLINSWLLALFSGFSLWNHTNVKEGGGEGGGMIDQGWPWGIVGTSIYLRRKTLSNVVLGVSFFPGKKRDPGNEVENFPPKSCKIPKFENGILLYTHKTSNFSIKVLHTWFKITLYTIDPNTRLTIFPHYISCNFLPKECYKQNLFWIFFLEHH